MVVGFGGFGVGGGRAEEEGGAWGGGFNNGIKTSRKQDTGHSNRTGHFIRT